MVAPTNIPLYSKIVLKTQYNRIYLTAPFSIAETDLDLLIYASYSEGDHSKVAGWAANKYQVRVRPVIEFAVRTLDRLIFSIRLCFRECVIRAF